MYPIGLPHQLTRFPFGPGKGDRRSKDVACGEPPRHAHWRRRQRQVTPVAPGGRRRSRALRGWRMVRRARIGRGSGLVPQTGRHGAGREGGAGKPITDTLIEHREPKRLLLVLFDNCEHVLDACARFVDAILCLVSGRLDPRHEPRSARHFRRACVPGAVAVRSRDRKQVQSPQEPCRRTQSVLLFIERALLVRDDFQVSPTLSVPRQRPTWTAFRSRSSSRAARVRTLSVQEIDGRLDQRCLGRRVHLARRAVPADIALAHRLEL